MTETTFVELCVRWLDGACSPEEMAALGEKLTTDPAARALWRDVCLHATWMREAPLERARTTAVPAARPVRLRLPAWSAAAAVVVAAGLLAALWPARTPPTPMAAVNVATKEVGTLFFYPFDGFPLLEPPDDPPSSDEPFRVPRVTEPDPRIVAIARCLHGPPALVLDL